MATDGLFDTDSAIDMATSGDVAVFNLVKTNSALKLVFYFAGVDFESVPRIRVDEFIYLLFVHT